MKARNIFTALILACIGFSCQQGGDYRYEDQPRQSAEYVVWDGPGYYYGIWFNSEGAYISWRNRRYGRPAYRWYRTYPRHYHRRGWGGRWSWSYQRRDDRWKSRDGRKQGTQQWRNQQSQKRNQMRDMQERMRRDRQAQANRKRNR